MTHNIYIAQQDRHNNVSDFRFQNTKNYIVPNFYSLKQTSITSSCTDDIYYETEHKYQFKTMFTKSITKH